MSHWTRAKISIKNPNRELLKQALQILAQELAKEYSFVKPEVHENGEITGWQGKQKVDFVIPARLRYGNGIGVKLDKGVTIVADVSGTPLYDKLDSIAAKLQQYYVALAVAEAAKQLGWSISNVQEMRDAVLIDIVTA